MRVLSIMFLPCGGGGNGRRREFGTLEHHNVVRVQVPFTAIISGAMRKKFAFQDEFPSGCPPADAVARDGIFFACHRESPPSSSDFTTAAQRDAYVGGCECRRRAHSIWSDLKAAQGLLKSYPRRFKYVSRGKVKKIHGVHAPTSARATHHSFWRYEDVAMHEIFTEQL